MNNDYKSGELFVTSGLEFSLSPDAPVFTPFSKCDGFWEFPKVVESSMLANLTIFGGVFAQHLTPWGQHNEDLFAVRNDENLEFWFHEQPLGDIDQVERILIRVTNPKTNKIRFDR